MSEVNLSAFSEADTNRLEEKVSSPMQEINEALKECKFGFFHIRLLFASFVGMVACVLVTNSSAYLMPNAECDLNMNLVEKGVLIAMPYFGCLISSIAAGFLTDTFGRKIFLITGFGGIFFFNIVSAASQIYEMLIFGKFFEGLCFAVAFNPVMTLTSEFCHRGIRDRVMLCQSSFTASAQIIVALLSWIILIQDWRVNLFDGYIVLNTWNIYLLICSLFPLISLLLYSLIPESPKFLLSQKKYNEARAVLIKIYVENTRRNADTYPFINLWKNESKMTPKEKIPEKTGLMHQIMVGLHNAKPIFQKPLGIYLAIISTMIFLCMATYNLLRLWFPQLSTILEHSDMGKNSTKDLCGMLDEYTRSSKVENANVIEGADFCVTKASGTETYVNSIVLGVVCLISYMVSGFLVNLVGKKFLLFSTSTLSFGAILGLRFSTTKTLVLILFSVATASSQTNMSLLQASVIEYFPTTTRSLALASMMMVGRIGTLTGNISFPILLKMGCVIPFYTLAGVTSLITIMSVFLPKKKH